MTRRSALHGVSTRATPQSRPILGSDQVPNSAGGFAWKIDKWKRLERFLILGTEGGTYYIGQTKLTDENVDALQECLAENSERTLQTIREISILGRAPKNDQALFALAFCMGVGDVDTRRAAADLLPEVARTGTHLFQFMNFVRQFRGMGPVLHRALTQWYERPEAEYQVVKYRQREGWTHADVLRLCKPVPADEKQSQLYGWITGKKPGEGFRLIEGFRRVQRVNELNNKASDSRTADLIREYGLTWEMIPPERLNSPIVYEALLEKMPMMATIRQLAKLTSVGVLKPFNKNVDLVIERLEGIKGSKVHPLQVLVAMRTYAQGHGVKGNLTWLPIPQIVDALDDAFYAAFENVETTGKTHVLGLDVSGSMDSYWGGGPAVEHLKEMCITPRDIAAVTAMVTVKAEPRTIVLAFSHQLSQIVISPKSRLDQVIEGLQRLPFGSTDCSIPILEAHSQGFNADIFAIYTDSETWAGHIHPAQALKKYRERFNTEAKLVVVGCTSNGFSIADPNDAGMLDVVGFDTSTPALIGDFVRD